MNYFIGYFILSIASVTLLFSKYRIFTDDRGRKVEAELYDLSGKTVLLKSVSGKIYNFPLEKLSLADQQYCQEMSQQFAVNLDAKIDFLYYQQKEKDLANEEAKLQGLFHQLVRPILVVSNIESTTIIREAVLTLVILGQSVLEPENYKNLSKERFVIDVDPESSCTLNGKSFEIKFNDQTNISQTFGYQYSGFLLVLKNKEGITVKTSATHPEWIQSFEKILESEQGEGIVL